MLLVVTTLSGHAQNGNGTSNSVDLLGPLPPMGFYTRLVDPSEYPNYNRRGFLMPTWKTFDNRPQMVGGRYLSSFDVSKPQLSDIPENGADMTGRPWLNGTVYQPNIGILRDPDDKFVNVLNHIKDIGMYLFNVGGYGPGSQLKGSYGQVKVPDTKKKALEEILGDRWLGFDLGEQDGRYHNGFAGRQLPAPRDRVSSHREFREWCDRVIDDQGGRLTMLTTLWGWHYPTQDGAMTLIGPESESKFGITSPHVQFAFLRGAGKQYGVLWFGNTALFSAFGVRYWPLSEDGTISTSGAGTSLNLMRRLYLTQWLGNSCILSLENEGIARTKDRKKTKVSPLGQVQLDTERLIRTGFTPGVMQTPVAILQDYFSGWMPARTNTTQFQSFNSLSYTDGDYLTDNLLSMLLPGYENSGWYFDERGALCPTPYGEIADCLLSDAPAEILSRYSLVLVSGIDHDSDGVRKRLDSFLSTGGTVMVTGDDAARLWPEYCKQETKTLPAGTAVQWSKGHLVDQEQRDFKLHEASLPAGAEVLATVDKQPAVVSIPFKSGTLIIALASTGLNNTPIPCQPSRNPYSQKGDNTGLERPYLLLSHVSRAYDTALKAQRLFTAGDGLSVMTGRRPDGKFVVTISNPDLESRPFAIDSHIGSIESIKEVSLGAPVDNLPGYWPGNFGPYDPKPKSHREVLGELKGQSTVSDDKNIRGGDIRVFEVTLKNTAVAERPNIPPPAAPTNRFLKLPELITLKERLLAWPRFAYEFDGVDVSAKSFLDAEPIWLSRNAPWFKRHGIRIIVDTRGLNEAEMVKVAERLAPFGKYGEMIVEKTPDALQNIVNASGIQLLSSDKVVVFKRGSAPKVAADSIQILEANTQSWESVYADVCAAWKDSKPENIAGPTESKPVQGQAVAGKNRYLSLRGIGDLSEALAARPGLLEKFDGLSLDAAWLFSQSKEAVAKDAELLKKLGLKTIIDFTSSINRFPDLTFASTVPHQYEDSVEFIDNALDKMAILGSTDAIICSHECDPAAKTSKEDWQDQIRGIERLLDKASTVGVNVHWRPSTMRPPQTLKAHADLVADLQSRHSNLKIAAGIVDEPDPTRLLPALEKAGKPELWLLAAPETSTERTGQRYLPISTFPAYRLPRILELSKGSKQVFDADYLSWDEVLADCQRAP